MMSYRGTLRQVLRPARAVSAAVLLLAMGLGACAHILGTGAVRPGAEAFGHGPRASLHGLYSASINPARPLLVGRMQSVTLRLDDAGGEPIEGATISIDGGMPQHGHGLPTQPRATLELGAGEYQVDGLKFNMGGWWELRFSIATEAGADTVVFNLDLQR